MEGVQASGSVISTVETVRRAISNEHGNRQEPYGTVPCLLCMQIRFNHQAMEGC